MQFARARLASILGLGLALSLGGLGCKGNPKDCEVACRNYANLAYWQTSDAEIAAAPPAAREALRKQKLAELTSKLDQGIDMCISQCVSANNPDQVKCMTEAKTADKVRACAEKWDGDKGSAGSAGSAAGSAGSATKPLAGSGSDGR
jgi:hypothetical protein